MVIAVEPPPLLASLPDSAQLATLAEIERWVHMGAEERTKIMAELPSRLAARPGVKLATG